MTERPIGFAKHNGAGEIIFRQAGHPSYDRELLYQGWRPLWTDSKREADLAMAALRSDDHLDAPTQ